MGWTHTVLALFIRIIYYWFLTGRSISAYKKLNLWISQQVSYLFYFEKSRSLYMSLGPSVCHLTGLVSIFYLGKKNRLYLLSGRYLVFFRNCCYKTSANLQIRTGIFTLRFLNQRFSLIWPVLLAVIVAVLISFLLSKGFQLWLKSMKPGFRLLSGDNSRWYFLCALSIDCCLL